MCLSRWHLQVLPPVLGERVKTFVSGSVGMQVLWAELHPYGWLVFYTCRSAVHACRSDPAGKGEPK
jgi:hypothetical protein